MEFFLKRKKKRKKNRNKNNELDPVKIKKMIFIQYKTLKEILDIYIVYPFDFKTMPRIIST